jgi:hypothetical protein
MLSFHLQVWQYVLADMRLEVVDYEWILTGNYLGEIGLQVFRIVTVVYWIFPGGKGVLDLQVALRVAIVQQSIHASQYKYQILLSSYRYIS